MLGRKREGSVLCPSCGTLVGVNDDQCLNCGRRKPGLFGFAPLLAHFTRGEIGFAEVITVACVVLFGLSLVLSVLLPPYRISMSGLMGFLSPSNEAGFLLGASGGFPVRGYGRWWTLFSASWLHGGLIHILFNMMWVRQLVPAVQELYGLSRMVIIYTASGVAGFALSSLMSFNLTLGASAAVFGLLGAMIHYSRRGGSSLIGQQAKMWALMLFIFGFMFSGIDNWAHLGGFGGGYLSSMWLDPLKPERGNHALMAVACLAVTALAIVLSVLTGLQVM